MKEKHKTATDESYRDLANLNEKLKKHEAFELELKANNASLNQINEVNLAFRSMMWTMLWLVFVLAVYLKLFWLFSCEYWYLVNHAYTYNLPLLLLF